MDNFRERFVKFVKSNDTNIMTGVGIADGLILGGYLWYRTGQKVQTILTQKQAENKNKLSFKDKFKASWKMFILPVVNTAVSGGLLIYSARVGNKKLAALGAAYNLTEAALQKYIDKTKEIAGDKKADIIKKEVAEESIQKSGDLVLMSENGDSIFYEPLTDRYFKSTWTKIQKSANELNASAQCGFDGRISLTDWFDKLGLPKTEISDEMGWDPQADGINGIIDIYPSAVIRDDDLPCGVINYKSRPKYFA